jgi:hypothetical protein
MPSACQSRRRSSSPKLAASTFMKTPPESRVERLNGKRLMLVADSPSSLAARTARSSK